MSSFHDDPVRRVLDRLAEMGKTIRDVAGQHLAQCPGHDDNNPSLAVREGSEGAMLQCHAGCDTADVVHAMGWEMRDLFKRRNGAALPGTHRSSASPSMSESIGAGIIERATAPRIIAMHPNPSSTLVWVADYIYRDAAGTPAFKVSRYAKLNEAGTPIGKAFHQFRRDPSGAGWTAGLGGAKPPLYRLPEVLAAVAAGEVVLVVEGERDADAAVAVGICATTSPMGAGKWLPEHTESLRGARVVILADDDPASKRYAGQRHAVTVQRALEGVAAQTQTALPAEGCKDLSEQLEAGYEPWAIRFRSPMALEALWVDAKVEEQPPAAPVRRVVLTAASSISMARVRWGWQDRMPLGELTLMPGREGVGKSLCLAWLAAQITRGTLPGEFAGAPRTVLYVASEDSWRYTIAPRMVAAGADLELIYRVEVDDVTDERLTLPIDCDRVGEAAEEVKAAALMLDPIISLIDDRLSVNQARELRRALEPLRRLAEQGQLMVLALAHFNKTTDVDTLSKIPGARAWAEVARAAFGLAEDQEADPPGYVASQIKNNLGRLNLPNLAYRIESVAVDTDEGPTDVGRLVWTGESDAGIDEVLSRRPERRGRDTSDVTKTIVAYIEECGYPVQVADVYQQFPEIKRETVRTTLRRSTERGTLSNPMYGHYGPGGGVSP